MKLSEVAQRNFSPDEVAQIFMDVGYKAQVDILSDGKRVIRSAGSGINFYAHLHGPKDSPDIVDLITFRVYFSKKVDGERLNKWNAEKRFVKAYSDFEGDLTLEWDVLAKFTTAAQLGECVDLWDSLLRAAAEI